MKVFLSWSGDLSLKIACALRDWLPSVIQSMKPYVSSEDIDKGTRWSTDIAKELEESSFGLICVTKDNMEAPWVNFEAGALSKTFDKSKVCPFLLNVKRSELQGPLLQFQSVIYDHDDIFKLVTSINATLPEAEQLDEARLKKVFEVWWPELQQELDSLDTGTPTPQPTSGSTPSVDPAGPILEELLELARTQQKLLRSPDELLPPSYMRHLMQRYVGPEGRRSDQELRNAVEHLNRRYRDLLEFATELRQAPSLEFEKGNAMQELFDRIESLQEVIRYLSRNYFDDDRDIRRGIPRRDR
jgi:TIR domain-containing protein